jgi:choline-sulfatase
MLRALLFVAMTASAVAQAPRRAEPAPPRPDVYLITIDTLRADHVGCYGAKSVKTPNLDSLCRAGIRFAQAISPAPITNSAHASIFTGLYPSHHGVTDFGIPLVPSHLTIAEILKQNGYATAAFPAAVILDAKTLAPGFGRGFDYYDSFPQLPPTAPRFGRLERRADDVVAHFAKWMSTAPAGPRFAWIHLYDPHDPYEPPAPYNAEYKSHLYDGEIAYADHALGVLMAALKRADRYNNALIIVVGDHGEGLGEHGEDTHGIFLYDSTLHVPLIIKLPASAHAGTVVAPQITSVDVVPTIVRELHIITTAKFDGAPLLASKSTQHQAVSETQYPLQFDWAPLKSLRAGGFKYIEAPRPELYNLHDDPKELNNIYAPWDQTLQKLRAELAEFRKTVPAQAAANAAAPVPENTLDELRALGYLGHDLGQTTAPEASLLPDPKDKIEVQNLLHAAMLANGENDLASARAALAKAVALDPNSATALADLGKNELKTGDARSAAQHLARAWQLKPQDSSIAVALGMALSANGDNTAAQHVLERALKDNPGQASPRVALGRIYINQNKLDAAQDQLEAALLSVPNNVDAHIALAQVFQLKGDSASAHYELMKAERLAPGNPTVKQMLQEFESK